MDKETAIAESNAAMALFAPGAKAEVTLIQGGHVWTVALFGIELRSRLSGRYTASFTVRVGDNHYHKEEEDGLTPEDALLSLKDTLRAKQLELTKALARISL